MSDARKTHLTLFASLGLLFGVLGTLVPPPNDSHAAPAPLARVQPTGILVLDDCDEQFRGKAGYEDNLTYFDATGKVVFRISGFNNCQSIGSNHTIAVDAVRGWIWVMELVGNRIHKFDRAGKELLTIPDIKTSALAVDPETGNLWVVETAGRIDDGRTKVFDPKGNLLATHNVKGFDITYDKKGKAFWLAGPKLTKIGVDGKVAFMKDIAVWCSVSVAVHPTTGQAWVAAREHSQVAGSKNELLSFDNDGTAKHAIGLGNNSPMHLSIDRQSGDVWVASSRKSVRRYSSKGSLLADHTLEAITCEADLTSNDVWVVTREKVLRMDTKGKVLHEGRHKSKTLVAWVAAF